MPAQTTRDHVVGCLGTGGYSGGTWSFSETEPEPLYPNLALCRFVDSNEWTPDVPSLSVPPNEPPAPEIDPGDPIGTAFSVGSTLCTPPGVCDELVRLVSAAPGTLIIPFTLSGTGNFACGNGSLSGDGFLWPRGEAPTLNIVWAATLSDGVGIITGTATDAWGGTGETWTLSGEMFINDGSPAACDDSAGNSQVGLRFTLTP